MHIYVYVYIYICTYTYINTTIVQYIHLYSYIYIYIIYFNVYMILPLIVWVTLRNLELMYDYALFFLLFFFSHNSRRQCCQIVSTSRIIKTHQELKILIDRHSTIRNSLSERVTYNYRDHAFVEEQEHF